MFYLFVFCFDHAGMLHVTMDIVKGSFRTVVGAYSRQQVSLRNEKARLANKWFFDEDNNQYMFVAKVELNSVLFRHPNPNVSSYALGNYILILK